jgi:hypothetical protein
MYMTAVYTAGAISSITLLDWLWIFLFPGSDKPGVNPPATSGDPPKGGPTNTTCYQQTKSGHTNFIYRW